MTSLEKLPSTMSQHGVSRRAFLAAGLIMTAGCFLPYKAIAAVSKVFSTERELSFFNIHTGEKMKAVYYCQGSYVAQALYDINYILRDYRTGGVKEIDTDLLDLLFALHQKLKSKTPFNVISGYRSPETNSLLSVMGKGVVKNSLHIYGKAIDIRLPGHELKTLQRAAIDLRRGGVGYYPHSDFVHVDVGRIRYW
jgi:uncharacterized protein YcbK (DUF882 family)